MKPYMRIAEVAEVLTISPETALRHVRAGRIPGGELLYKLEDGRERWRVQRDAFEKWRAANAADAANAANSTKGSGMGTS